MTVGAVFTVACDCTCTDDEFGEGCEERLVLTPVDGVRSTAEAVRYALAKGWTALDRWPVPHLCPDCREHGEVER